MSWISSESFSGDRPTMKEGENISHTGNSSLVLRSLFVYNLEEDLANFQNIITL